MKYFIDFEATQFSNEIISIGCVRETGETFYALVNPKKKLTQFITDLTGITDEMLRNAPEADIVFKEFFDWCSHYENDPRLFYCYGSSDITFVKNNARKSNKGMFKRPFSFDGRIRRLELWLSLLILYLYAFLIILVKNALEQLENLHLRKLIVFY